MDQRRKKVIIYCRESRDDGFLNYERIETQRDILTEYCEKHGLGDIVRIIMDDNKSGTSFERLKPVKDMVMRGEADILLCKDASRLGRNILESLSFTEFLNNNGAELVFESERYDEDIFPLIAWFNERRVKDDSIKIRRVLRRKMEEGAMVIKAPYGYIKDGSDMKTDNAAAPIVREIFGAFINGDSMGDIARALNAKGCPTPSRLRSRYEGITPTDVWNRQHISRILRHRAYTGDMSYGMREKVSYKSNKYVSKQQGDWIVIANHHEPIVTREVFDTAQAKLKRKARAGPGTPDCNAFSGFLFCGRCGCRMVKVERVSLKPAYVCGKSHREGRVKSVGPEGRGCPPHRICHDTLVSLVGSFIKILTADINVKERLNEILHGELQNVSLSDSGAKQVKLCEDKLSRLKGKASLIYEDRLNGIIPEYLFKQKLAEINAEINKETITCENRIKELKESAGRQKTLGGGVPSMENIIDEMCKTIDPDTVAALFVRIIVFDSEEITQAHKAEYNLPEREYERVRTCGGIVFVQNFLYPMTVLDYKKQQ